MRHTRRFGRVNAVKVNANIQWAFKYWHLCCLEIQHWQYFDIVAFGLFAAMRVQCANTNLY